jgi:hypothetical protein
MNKILDLKEFIDSRKMEKANKSQQVLNQAIYEYTIYLVGEIELLNKEQQERK